MVKIGIEQTDGRTNGETGSMGMTIGQTDGWTKGETDSIGMTIYKKIIVSNKLTEDWKTSLFSNIWKCQSRQLRVILNS